MIAPEFEARLDAILVDNAEVLRLLADDEPEHPAWQYAFALEEKLATVIAERDRLIAYRTTSERLRGAKVAGNLYEVERAIEDLDALARGER